MVLKQFYNVEMNIFSVTMNSVFSFFIFLCYVVSLTSAKNAGFTTNLYHRDHVRNPALSKIDRLNRGINRDLAKMSVITPNTPHKRFRWGAGTYMIKLALGTPPYEFFARADTGSDVTWIQCQPCENCYHQETDIFNPVKQSSTFQTVKCPTGQFPCPAFDGVNCVDNVCKSLVTYRDGSFSKGTLSTDTLTVRSATGQPIVVDHYIFQCATYNDGNFFPYEAGIVGLGRGQRSLITQLDKYINGKFSYCLFADMKGGKMHLGHAAMVQGHGVVTTPIFEGEGENHNLYLGTLEALTIGGERLHFSNKPGNIIIDSGTTVTQFPRAFYIQTVASVTRQVTAIPVHDPSKRLKVCFDEDTFNYVPMTAHFTGANVVLREYNMFQRVGPHIVCLTVTQGPYAIWGNTAQLDFLVGFDVNAGSVSFKSTEC